MPRIRPRVALLGAVVVAAATGVTVAAQQPASAATTVQVWWSSESRTAGFEPKSGNWYANPATGAAGIQYKLAPQPDAPITGASGTPTITANLAQQYQTVLGVGSSIEESTVYNLARMTPAARDRALRALFDPATGAGFSVARIAFGSSDFTSSAFYTYNDGAADPGLTRFSIQRDIDLRIIETIKQARAINPNLKLFGSVWSPPGWMKSSGAIIGGNLLDQHIGTLAAYYRRSVQAYAAQGIPIHGVTLQNEPLFLPADYPGMLVSADQERRLARALRTEFTNAGLGATKIWAFDHNFGEGMSYTQGVIGAPGSPNDAYSSVDGIAFHDYGGEPATMGQVKASWPAKDVLLTERSVWGTAGADRIVQYFRNQATMYQSWVTMLDQNRSPERWSGSPDPTMLIQNPNARDTYHALPEYYFTAQFSKFVKPGAKRVNTGYGSTGTVTNVAFLNPDGSLVTVVVNQTTSAKPFTLRVGNQQISSSLPAKTVGTYIWADAGSGGPTTPPTTPPTSTPPTGGGQIVGYGGKCVDIAGASPANGTPVQLYTCNGSTAQRWTVGGDGTIRALGKCLDVAGANPANGTRVQIYDCNGSTAQRWTASGGTSGGTLAALGKCLDATNVSSADGTPLQIWTCGTGANQRWTLPA